jgi:hypothetical protein
MLTCDAVEKVMHGMYEWGMNLCTYDVCKKAIKKTL